MATTLVLMGCGQGHKAESLIKDHIDAHLKNKGLSAVSFSELDSTGYINRALVDKMRRSPEINSLYDVKDGYVDPVGTDKLMFMSVTMSDQKGKKSKHTFYLNHDLTGVVCAKVDHY